MSVAGDGFRGKRIGNKMSKIEEIRPQVVSILARISGIPIGEIGEKATFEELDLDSLSRIEVMVELEREFGLESSDDDEEDEEKLARIQSVEDAAQLVLSGLTAAQTAV